MHKLPFNTNATPAPQTANEKLFAGIAAQDMSAVKEALAEGADIDAVDANGDPALYVALQQDNKIIPYILLEEGADPVLPDQRYDAQLMRDAASFGILSALEKLLDAGVSIATQPKDDPLLHKAVLGGHAAVAKKLIAAGADVNEQGPQGSALRAAMGAYITGNNAECVKIVLDAGADPYLESYDHSHGGTISDLESAKGRDADIRRMVEVAAKRFEFFVALDGRDLRKMKQLLEQGISPDVRDPAGDTALMRAAGGGFDDGVLLLLEKGADISLTGAKGRTALHKAAAGPSVGVAQQLAEAGASALARDEEGKTPLQYAERATMAASPAVRTVIRERYEAELQAVVDKSMHVQTPVKTMPRLRIKPRGKQP
ncbi:MAG: hypothetical protein GC185_11630 [Alphaproteobacteria bacterium]|nr:hypothetical protein [Alphaproteobacteria bacterium]